MLIYFKFTLRFASVIFKYVNIDIDIDINIDIDIDIDIY